MINAVRPSCRVLVVEDHVLVRKGVCALLRSLPHVTIVAEASNGEEALVFVDTHQPDLVLMDVTLPGLNGLEASARILGKAPMIRILFLSMHANEEYVRQALSIGACGYILKGADPEELEHAIGTVMQGHTYLPHEIGISLKDGPHHDPVERGSDLEALTPRQTDILKLIVEGKGTRQIAADLQVSIKTVETHRMHIMDRLKIHSVAGLVRFAIRKGLIPPY